MRSRSFRVGPADDNEFLGFSAVALRRRPRLLGALGALDRLETTPSKPSFPACFRMSSPSPVSWPLN